MASFFWKSEQEREKQPSLRYSEGGKSRAGKAGDRAWIKRRVAWSPGHRAALGEKTKVIGLFELVERELENMLIKVMVVDRITEFGL